MLADRGSVQPLLPGSVAASSSECDRWSLVVVSSAKKSSNGGKLVRLDLNGLIRCFAMVSMMIVNNYIMVGMAASTLFAGFALRYWPSAMCCLKREIFSHFVQRVSKLSFISFDID